jgi:hypothetical protein
MSKKFGTKSGLRKSTRQWNSAAAGKRITLPTVPRFQ